jgi:DNA polymerase-3 subunit epsilon
MAKQKFPGAMHNLDALCRRFEIDASARTVHGALLDAQILSQVYIAMTGGQSNLFNESENKNPNSTEQMTPSSNDSWPELSIHYANETEVQEHANYFAKFN